MVQCERAERRRITSCNVVYHINGQHTVTVNGSEAEGIAYCQATLVNTEDGRDVATTNYVRYGDLYEKVDGRRLTKPNSS